MRLTTAIFPVAGLGTRFLPATKAIPKEMMIVGDKPLIQYAVEEAKSCGIERFIFVTSASKPSIAAHFDYNGDLESQLITKNKKDALNAVKSCTLKPGEAIFTYQQQPLGLGHAVACGIPWLKEGEPFAVILPDDFIDATPFCLNQMWEAYRDLHNHETIMVAAQRVHLNQTSSYGIFEVQDEKNSLLYARDIVEKPDPKSAPSSYAAIGRYILPFSIIKNLRDLTPGSGGELQLTDALRTFTKNKGHLHGFLFNGKRFDCGSKEGWREANLAVEP